MVLPPLGDCCVSQVQSGQDYVYHVRAVNFIGVGPGSLWGPSVLYTYVYVSRTLSLSLCPGVRSAASSLS